MENEHKNTKTRGRKQTDIQAENINHYTKTTKENEKKDKWQTNKIK